MGLVSMLSTVGHGEERVKQMKELLEKFNALNEQEKLEFVKAIMPQMCSFFQENQQKMMSMCCDIVDSQSMRGKKGSILLD